MCVCDPTAHICRDALIALQCLSNKDRGEVPLNFRLVLLKTCRSYHHKNKDRIGSAVTVLLSRK